MRKFGGSMRPVCSILVASFIAAPLIPADAVALDGTQLYQSCRAKERTTLDFVCVAYIHGFLDGMATGQATGEQNPPMYCPPKGGISVDQGRLIVEKYLRDHPEQLHKEAGLLAASALWDAFPCRRNSN